MLWAEQLSRRQGKKLNVNCISRNSQLGEGERGESQDQRGQSVRRTGARDEQGSGGVG